MRRCSSALAFYACATVLGGCTFRANGADVGIATDDLAPADLSVGDIDDVDLFVPDLSQDLLANDDFSDVDFSTPAIDLAGRDLLPVVPGFPSNVGYHYLADSAAEWTVTENTTIDTSLLKISSPTPAGLIFVDDGVYAVLALKMLTVGSAMQADVRLTVVGDRPLVIVAGTEIHVYGLIDAGAHANVPGPGGAPPATGAGQGASATGQRSGGGGAGYGTVGGGGGGDPLTAGGAIYGDVTSFVGGAGGGSGAAGVTPRTGCTTPSVGGGGGGELQLSSRMIVLEAAPMQIGPFTQSAGGTISVSGGGGAGGCAATTTGSGGAGGGSGGSLLIESPSLTLSGRIVSAGGGGGAGGAVQKNNPSQFLDGRVGYDGFEAASPGFSSGGGVGFSSGGAGYNGLVSTPASAKDGGWMSNAGATTGGGGGGGGAGRIRIRASVAQGPTKASPPPTVVVDLPSSIP